MVGSDTHRALGVSKRGKLMQDIRTHFEKKKGWWIEERSTVPCALPADGQVVAFRRVDIEKLMDEKYPSHTYANSEKVWYFNETRDREIAETQDDRIVCNPQVLWEHYLKR